MNVRDLIHYLSEQPQDAEVVVFAPDTSYDTRVRAVQDIGENGFYRPDTSWRGGAQTHGEWGYRLEDFGNEDDQTGAVPALYLFSGDTPPKGGV